MSARYRDVVESLRTAYDGAVEHRDRMEKAPWKVTERAAFLRRLRDESCRRLLELGAGTGQDSAFFAGHGLQVVATDLSPEMVARCREKGLDARVMDFLHLDFPAESFDAVYALNCLLHVPNADLPAVLEVIASVLRPGGLFFLGVYGRDLAEEGAFEDGIHHPPRFFSWRTDEQIQQFARRGFDIVDFHVVGQGRQHFQSLTLRR
jgi:SAM-dependent methyltransferase